MYRRTYFWGLECSDFGVGGWVSCNPDVVRICKSIRNIGRSLTDIIYIIDQGSTCDDVGIFAINSSQCIVYFEMCNVKCTTLLYVTCYPRVLIWHYIDWEVVYLPGNGLLNFLMPCMVYFLYIHPLCLDHLLLK